MKRVTLEEYWPAKKIANKYEKQIRDAGKLLSRYRRNETKHLVSSRKADKTKILNLKN